MPRRPADPRVQDAALALLLTLGTVWEGAGPPARSTAGVCVLVGQVAAALALAWRRRTPSGVAAVVLLAFFASAFATDVPENLSATLVVFVAGYSSVAHAPSWRVAAACAAGFALVGGAQGHAYYGQDPAATVISAGMLVSACAVGALVRRTREEAVSAERRAASAEDERDAHARAAVTAERARIARELHDVVAHAISVVVLQARGGRRMLEVDPAESRAAFDAVEQVGEQALTEMRRLLALLRVTDPPQEDDGVQPSLRHLDDLVAETTAAGTQVTVDVLGDVSAVPSSIDVTAYRILQEALTNVRRHSSARSVRVTVAADAVAVEIDVLDDGAAAGPTADGAVVPGAGAPGYGIIGMRERAALFGGELTAGRAPTGGFRVHARVPLRAAPT